MTDQKCRIAVVVPYINLGHYVLDLWATLKTKHDLKIILVDNNSDQKTKDEVNAITGYDNVDVIYNESNAGVSGSWNMGIEYALNHYSLDYIFILNNDILLHPECLDTIVATMLEHDFALLSATDFSSECARPHDILELTPPKTELITDCPDFSCFCLNVAKLYNMSAYEQDHEEWPGRFDQKFYPAYFEDNDFHYRLKLQGERGVKTNRALFYHYGSRTIRENADVGEISNTYFLGNQDRFKKKWGGLPGKETFKIPFDYCPEVNN